MAFDGVAADDTMFVMNLHEYVADVPRLVEAVLVGSTSRHSSLHGESHWKCVAWTGPEIARETPGCDAALVFLFALLHDTKRLNDGHDPEHGPRAAQSVRELQERGILALPPEKLDTLARACAEHTSGHVTDDPTIGACWDADRLNLWRIGVRPDPRRLSTRAAREPAAMDRARRFEGQQQSWDAIAANYQYGLALPQNPSPAASSPSTGSPVRRVIDEPYYYIRRDSGPDWEPGMKLTFGTSPNPFRRKVESFAPSVVGPSGGRYPVNEVARHAIEVAGGSPPRGQLAHFYHFDPVKTLAETNAALEHYLIAVRDLILEEVRREDFADRPSRDSCGWLIPNTKQGLRYWRQVLCRDGARAYSLSATGVAFAGQHKLLRLRTDSLEELRRIARRYWLGCAVEAHKDIEVLFVGEVTVLRSITTLQQVG